MPRPRVKIADVAAAGRIRSDARQADLDRGCQGKLLLYFQHQRSSSEALASLRGQHLAASIVSPGAILGWFSALIEYLDLAKRVVVGSFSSQTHATGRNVGDRVTVQLVSFGSEAAKYGLAPGDEITSVLIPAHRPSRYWFAIPALLLLRCCCLAALSFCSAAGKDLGSHWYGHKAADAPRHLANLPTAICNR